MRHSSATRRLTDEFNHPVRLVVDQDADALPPNPAVRDGTLVRYLGPDHRRVEGEATGFVYHADALRRLVKVDHRDLPGILTTRAFVLDG